MEDNRGTTCGQPGGIIWRVLSLASGGSHLSPAHATSPRPRATSPRPHARHEHETETEFPVGVLRFTSISPPNLRYTDTQAHQQVRRETKKQRQRWRRR
eukprot:4386055-Alexandrium_andersonii.AAC.1